YENCHPEGSACKSKTSARDPAETNAKQERQQNSHCLVAQRLGLPLGMRRALQRVGSMPLLVSSGHVCRRGMTRAPKPASRETLIAACKQNSLAGPSTIWRIHNAPSTLSTTGASWANSSRYGIPSGLPNQCA